MTGNAQEGAPFSGTARPQSWVMRSLSPWISRMASGAASRASTPVSPASFIGAQTARQAHWISRRADRIQRAAAWDGDIGNVSPALVDRFSQRVADRVQRSTRAHQVDSYSGGDNLDSALDMPLVTNEGSITPLSDGHSDETPFEFGSFSPENVQRKPEAPSGNVPPMPEAMRERAEQLRRSMATNTPAPPAQPDARAPAIQPSRLPGISLPSSLPPAPAPRVTMQRARPASRVEEIGTGKAPKPAPPEARVPEPPRAELQRSPQTPAPRATPSVPVPTVQRAAIPPNVVQGQGRLTQMLQSRFKPKLDQARNPDAPSEASGAGDDFSSDAGPISSAPSPRISRSAQPPASTDFPGSDTDLTPRAPVQRAPAPDAGDATTSNAGVQPARPTLPPSPADVPVPTPKARVLRKPAMPNTPTPPAAGSKPPTATAAPSAPAVQRKADTSAPSDAAETPAINTQAAPAPVQRSATAGTPAAGPKPPATPAAPSAPAVQRKADTSAPSDAAETPAINTQAAPAPVQRSAAAGTPAERVEATQPDVPPPAIQREMRVDADSGEDMPVVAPAAKADALMPDNADAPALQRGMADESSAPPMAQRSTAPVQPAASTPASDVVTRVPAEWVLRAPAASVSAPADADDAGTNTPAVQRSPAPAAPAAPAPAAPAPSNAVQRVSPEPPAALPLDAAVHAVSEANASAVQRSAAQATTDAPPPSAPIATPEANLPEMILRAPATQADDGAADYDAALAADAPAIQRSAAQTIAAQPAAPSAPATTSITASAEAVEGAPAIQRLAVNAPVEATPAAADLPAVSDAMPLVQRAPADDAGSANEPSDGVATNGVPAIQRAQGQSPSADAAQTPVVQRQAETAQPPMSQTRDSAMGVIQREESAPALRNDAAGDLTLRAPATREAGDVAAGSSEAPPSTPAAAGRVQRNTVQRGALPAPAPTPATPPLQRGNAEMVLRSPAMPASETTLDAEGMSDGAPAQTGAPVPFVQRAFAEGLKPAKTRAGVSTVDMPVLRAVTRDAGEAVMPESRTLAMPIVQRAAVKQERQAAQEAQARPANPYVAQQERAERLPVVQRAPAAETPDVQRAGDAEMAAKAVENSAPQPSATQGVNDRAITEAELLKTAQRLLPIIKRMLAVERERLFGR